MSHTLILIRILFAFYILFYSSGALGQCPTVNDGLIAHFLFEDNTNDESGNNWHGIIFGNPLFLDGRVGKAIYCDGSSDLIGISDNFQLLDSFTVMAWIKTETIDREWQTIFCKFPSGISPPFWFGLYYGKVYFDITDANGYNWVFNSNSSIEPNKWYHISWVGDPDKGYIYINGGEFDSSKPELPPVSESSDIVTIGAQVSGNGPKNNYEGWIDDLRVYNRALTKEEINCIVPTNDIYLGHNSIELSPNPNSGIFTLQFEEKTSNPLAISIFSTLGKMIDHQKLKKGSTTLDFDLSKQVDGLYFLSVQDEKGTYLSTLKFLIR